MTGNDSHYDVIVVGSGAGGLSAALSASEHGLAVLVLEKAGLLGGTTAYSGGVVWVPSDGGEGEDDKAATYLRAVAGNHFAETRAKPYIERAREALDFLTLGTGLTYTRSYFPDYHQEAAGAVAGGRSWMPGNFDRRKLGVWADKIRPPLASMTVLGGLMVPTAELPHFLNYGRSFASFRRVARLALRYGFDRLKSGRSSILANGNALVGGLVKALVDRRVEIRTNTAVFDLIMQNGRVTGVRYSSDGQNFDALASRGVVLAAGGIPHDRALRDAIQPATFAASGERSLAPAENTGDGVALAQRASAALCTSVNHTAAWAPTSYVPVGGVKVPFPHFRERGKAGYIMVDATGHRFTNEARSYMTVGAAMIEAGRRNGRIETFMIGDHATLRREGLGPVPPGPLPLGRFVRNGYLIRSSTISGLAQKIGVDPDALQRTIADYNQHAAKGDDPAFGRGSDAYQTAYGSRGNVPNPCVGPILQSPFYALKIHLGDLGTFVGLMTDERARVLDGNGSPVPGLFATGNDMASVMGGTYPGAGITLGPAITYGYIVGRVLAGVE